MDYRKSNLNNLIPLWERTLPNFMHEPPLESFIRSDEDIPATPSTEDVIGKGTSLAQDIFSALILRQGRLKRTQI